MVTRCRLHGRGREDVNPLVLVLVGEVLLLAEAFGQRALNQTTTNDATWCGVTRVPKRSRRCVCGVECGMWGVVCWV